MTISNFAVIVILLAILGIVGDMDYQDAVQAQVVKVQR